MDAVGDLRGREAVERGLRDLPIAVVLLTRERDDRAIGALAVDEVRLERLVVLHRALDAARHDHRAGLTLDLLERDHLLVEVVDHDLGLEADRGVVALDVAAQLLARPLHVELGVALDGLDQLVVAVDRRVALEHVEDEALVDGLLHRVAVERPVRDLALGVHEELLSQSHRPTPAHKRAGN